MAEFLKKSEYVQMSMPKAMNRTNPTPLDASAVWTSLDELKAYAQNNPVAYVGQILSLVSYNAETEQITEVKAYIIKDTLGNIEEVGSATLGDNASIELIDGVLSVKDFGKKYYKYVAAVEGGEAAHYELVEGWATGLEPRVVAVNGESVIGWYEPNPTTVEGVKDQVVDVQNEVKGIEDLLNGTDEEPGLIEEVDNITEALYGTEGENPVPGLIKQVETLDGEIDAVAKDLADNYYKKSETYTKTEVDGLVSGVFHFEGAKDSYDALPIEGNTKGDVYQVGDKEYAWNGTEWVELGFVVDLSGYYTKAEVDAEVKEVQDALDAAEEDIAELVAADTTINGRIDGLEQAHETINSAIDAVEEDVAELVAEDKRLAGLISGHEDRIADIETAKGEFDSQFEAVDGKIAALERADSGFDTRVSTLETNVGTPSENFKTALFPAVETLKGRIDGLEAVGAEANLINGLTINGTALVPNAEKIIDLPVFAGSTAGLVPVVNGLDNTYYLNAMGEWSIPQDSRIGDLGEHATVVDYIDNKFTWSSIVE